ncbi:MAG: hypothetical protein V5A64_04580 [Candidatus Thermoplasmatota archaeon]
MKIILIAFITSTATIIATTPLHEAGHWMMSEMDPYIEPIEYHVFDGGSIKKQEEVLFSPLGQVVIQEKYPGAFNERPIWWNFVQEIICVLIQVVIAVLVTIKTIYTIVDKKFKVDFSRKLF